MPNDFLNISPVDVNNGIEERGNEYVEKSPIFYVLGRLL